MKLIFGGCIDAPVLCADPRPWQERAGSVPHASGLNICFAPYAETRRAMGRWESACRAIVAKRI
ncbi:hypothetical protein [uncultured Jannaschia sp.]|uniref:hypothetical protein n=1 Tax=uncultured Jannaschia sp. TaxID=293347 RepID=UPI00260F52AD|nr:hypothetical protein [uncultured Jannaschia sp.]